jgi:hypothetical protein
MMSIRERPVPPSAVVGIAALTLLVCALDLVTALGVSVWVFYLVPLGLTLLLSGSALPLAVAAATTLLMGVGFVASPAGVDDGIAATNRIFGIVVIWLVAVLARWLILSRQATARLAWLQDGQAQLARCALGELRVDAMGERIIATLCRVTGASVGAIYLLEGTTLARIAGYALDARDDVPTKLELGQGLAGQAARDGEARSV